MPKRNISLNGLRVFESAARLLSFTQAAEEHHVTQAAVSQQIRALENRLGIQLFRREKRGLTLTLAGSELAQTTRMSLNRIYDTIDHITGSDAEGVLTISTLASFASRWLIPRLADFQKLHDQFDLHVHTSDELIDLSGSKVDAGIRFSSLPMPGLCTELLMLDAACMVCAPTLAKDLGDDPTMLYEHTLIVDGNSPEDPLGNTLPECTSDRIIEALSLDQSRVKLLVFSQSDNVVQSALAGQGIAITRLTLCADEIDAGHLQIVLGYCRPFDHGYSLVYPEFRANDARLVAFRQWLSNESRLFCDRIDQIMAKVIEQNGREA